ncbi:hypothetical protein OE88DRAFT_1649453 [Heliocybe sulcata]|uniref:Tyr recombinase domain-containing protein n=1 Tax=Heliocybe sulcata TaxID=5364 RepID=A0A5C3MIK8_9AGAM|nr:hypothetical protein OE88DRAFT_1649453 [Heliocybe sulcata]
MSIVQLAIPDLTYGHHATPATSIRMAAAHALQPAQRASAVNMDVIDLTDNNLIISSPQYVDLTGKPRLHGESESGSRQQLTVSGDVVCLLGPISSGTGRHTGMARTRAKGITQAGSDAIKNGKKFLASLVSVRKTATSEQLNKKHGPEDAIDLDELALAFDKPPNQYSGLALEFYLTEKCINQNLKEQTAVQIYSAFKRMWEQMDAETYRGPYSYDAQQKIVHGNPALSAGVQDLWHSLQNRSRAEHGKRTHHAEAIGIEDMRVIMAWSESQIPPAMLEASITDLEVLFTAIFHALARALLTCGFILWARNNELCALRGRDITEGCIGPPPYYFIFDKVTLDQRKGWLSRPGSGTHSQGRTYEIHSQPKTPEICMRLHLSRWLRFREKVLGHLIGPDEFVFPHPMKPLNHEAVQKILDEFTTQSGLTKNFSTHSFRRGGAQYRFIWAPVSERWSLAEVRWWGGWSEGELEGVGHCRAWHYFSSPESIWPISLFSIVQ